MLIMVSMIEMDWAPLRCISVYSGTVGCSGVCERNGICSVESTRDGMPLHNATIYDLKLTRSYSKNRGIAEKEGEVCTTYMRQVGDKWEGYCEWWSVFLDPNKAT